MVINALLVKKMLPDEVDLKILSILLRNSRVPYRRLAKELGLGESTVYTRINKLIKSGILKSFTVSLDYVRLGYTTEAVLEIKAYPQQISKVKASIRKLPFVAEASLLTGDYPIVVTVLVRNNEELASRIDEVAKIDGVADMNIRYVLERITTREKSSLISGMLKEIT